ncbi:MAG: ornithine cyclodeaminase family protein [Acidimicrobiia bacterium]|nr:ornithine cyclodeaminase family protein [Acidimicrobiia bacterium]MYJ13256.1 ornithine cyclodeaminase family protein [Acidimicrobiia bacterium]
MEILDAGAVRAATPWPKLMEAIADALGDPGAVAPERHVHPVAHPDGAQGSLLLMPAWRSGDVIGVKAVTYFPANATGGASSISAGYLLFDGRSGRLRASLDGDELTVRRTAAVSALAARYLARPDAARLLVVGTGRLASAVAEAHAHERRVTSLEVWGRNARRAAAVAETLAAGGLPARAVAALDAAVAAAELITCVTGATEPLIAGHLLSPGVHLDLIGGFRADMREADDEAVRRAAVFVDTRPGAVLAGDLAGPLAAGVIEQAAVAADLADLTSGRHGGRSGPEQITLFKSAGFALADLAAAQLVWASVPQRTTCRRVGP